MTQRKIRIGIFFGGTSREREISFAGGRTVYDNLDKELFEAVPIFVDSLNKLVELNWEYIYRGTIRDFYPPASYLPETPNHFQVYAESLQLSESDHRQMLETVGTPLSFEDVASKIDVAFLAMHGEDGEDGRLQGVMEWLGIPYTGSGILASSIGIDKSIQKIWMERSGFKVPQYQIVEANEWKADPTRVFESVKNKVGFPLVVKAAHQGSSIGITILKEEDLNTFSKAMNYALFTYYVSNTEWNEADKVEWVRRISDIRGGIGFPMYIEDKLFYHPEKVLDELNHLFESKSEVRISAFEPETTIVVESMLHGQEFSCIVVSDDNGEPVALPPTEIVKGDDLFDYRSKYLPGLSRKVTPINTSTEKIEEIRTECERLYNELKIGVYARIDGFLTEEGEVYLNDPNTTSGMMPSSFFFHQAAEIGLNPSQFLTYLIRTSLQYRSFIPKAQVLLKELDHLMISSKENAQERKKVGVIMGGYSTERHISVESGRNIYEKLSSSIKYEPIPIFLTGSNDQHELFKLPVNIMLKDNADDIKGKVENYSPHPILATIIDECTSITERYAGVNAIHAPIPISYDDLAQEVDEVFIALHGRPGEDGAVQQRLEKFGIPYNGSNVESSQLTINKYLTNNKLRDNGFLVAGNYLVEEDAYADDPSKVIDVIENMGYPLIAKPVDEGCSSAVLKISNREELIAYAQLTFRGTNERDEQAERLLGVDPKDEFPAKPYFLIENFIRREGASHFLEITGGMLTHVEKDGEISYEVFEPSEALAEGEVLSLAEKFLAGEGQNITPARFAQAKSENGRISKEVRNVLEQVARTLNVEGYCRIDAFVRIWEDGKVDVIIIEINSLPGMTPATCIYHQAALNGYKPYEFIDGILTFGEQRLQMKMK